jgi:hypothetical protein
MLFARREDDCWDGMHGRVMKNISLEEEYIQ